MAGVPETLEKEQYYTRGLGKSKIVSSGTIPYKIDLVPFLGWGVGYIVL